MDLELENLTVKELKELADNKNIPYENNIKKDDLILLLQNSEPQKTYSLNDVIAEIKENEEIIKSKKYRNDEIVKNNKYLDSRIMEVKTLTDITPEDKKSRIEHFNKIKDENSRQFNENTKLISELELKLVDLNATKMDLGESSIKELKKEYNKIQKEISLYPETMAKEVARMSNEYSEKVNHGGELENKIMELCNLFAIPYTKDIVAQGKLTISEKTQLVNRLKDLSKINTRLASR